MKKQIDPIHKDIYLIENYISKDTAKYITDSFNKNLVDADKPNVYGGPSSENASSLDPVGFYNDDPDFNVSVDILNGILMSIRDTVSIFYNKNYEIKNSFYSAMKSGGYNEMHMDNHYIDKNNEVKVRGHYGDDRSAILYLNEDYTGGLINFPNQNLTLKPRTGSLIFFEGNFDKPHEVTEVKSGIRNNIITFLGPSQLKE